MTRSYAETQPLVRAEILRRVAAGEDLKAICAEPGKPCPESVTLWARTDAAFGAAYAAAKAQRAWRRKTVVDPAKAAVLLERLANGEPIAEVLRDPAMPSQQAYRLWRANDPAFAEEVARINAVKLELKRGRMARRYRAFDPEVGERIYVRLWHGERLRAILRSDKAFPSLAVFERWRRENPEFDAQMRFVLTGWKRKRAKERTLCTPEMADEIFDLIVQGHSLRSISRLPGMPSQGALYNWCRDRPEFSSMVERACVYREDWYNDQILDIAERVTPASLKAARRQIAEFNKQQTRLRKRPGWKRRRAARER